MTSASEAYPDIDQLTVMELKALLVQQQKELASKDQELNSYKDEVAVLKLQILKLRRMQFGQKSEQRERQIEQLELLVEDIEITEAQHVAAVALPQRLRTTAKQSRIFPAHLPREIHTITPAETSCPDCGGAFGLLGEDVSETLELEPIRFKVIKRVRPKFACTCCDTIVQAPAPSRPIERGIAGPALLAHVVAGKYADHLPLYRQSEIFAREGIDLDRTLLADWVGNCAALFAPLVAALRTHVFAAEVVHADDTPVPVLAPGNGKTRTGRFWTYVRDERPAAGEAAPAVWFAYTPDRKGINPQQHVDGFSGTFQADGYGGFSKIYKGEDVFEAACWAHVRRKFFDIEKAQKSPIAKEVLDRIAALYVIESEIRGKPAEERRKARCERTRPLLDAMKICLDEKLRRVSQKCEIAKAIRYALNRWEALERFCDDGRIEIDNNAAERALRCIALGRKNYLFAGSDAGGERAAAMYSLIGSAKLNGVNPEAYLHEVLQRIADHPIAQIAELLPWNLQVNDLKQL
jgi:transposase